MFNKLFRSAVRKYRNADKRNFTKTAIFFEIIKQSK